MTRACGAFLWDVCLVCGKVSASQTWGSGCVAALTREAAAILGEMWGHQAV